MRFCEFDKGCDQPVFSTDKLTRKGYCNRHTWCRTDISKKSITQRAIEKHKANPTKQITKEPRFRKPTKEGWLDVKEAFEPELNSKIIPTTPTPECYDGKETDMVSMDEMGMYGKMGIIENVGMDAFWKYAEGVIAKGGSKCWECGDIISRSDYRNSTGHIFPKSIFPSVADNIYNFVVVGCRCGCHNKTHTLATFSQMSIFPTAVNRYTKFGHLITENHKYLDLFLDYANQII